MSIRLMSLIWEIEFPTHAQKLVALKLADYAADNGSSIFPAVNTIAKHTGSDERTVQRVLKAFRGCGLLELVKEGGTGPKSTNQWMLNVPLLVALAYGECAITGSASELEIEGETKGDILSSKGDILSADDALRVTNSRLRVASTTSKGGSGATQSTNNHQLDSSTRERACAIESATAHRAEGESAALVVRTDPTWKLWLNWLRSDGHHQAADALEAEGAMVVFAPRPHNGCRKPKLPPLQGSARWNELQAQRQASNITARMIGESAA